MDTPRDGRKLSRTSSHRIALLRNLSLSLFKYDKIETTYPKAKELERFAGKLIHLAKTDALSNRRKVAEDIKDKEILAKLFDNIAKRYAERQGGYLKVLKTGRRTGDGASMAVIKLV